MDDKNSERNELELSIDQQLITLGNRAVSQITDHDMLTEVNPFGNPDYFHKNSVTEYEVTERNRSAYWIRPDPRTHRNYDFVLVDFDVYEKELFLILSSEGKKLVKNEDYILKLTNGIFELAGKNKIRNRNLDQKIIDTLKYGKKVPSKDMTEKVYPAIQNESFDFDSYRATEVIDI